MGPGYPIPHKELTDSEDSIDSETESIMTATTKELIETLTKTLKNINQSPTIPLPVFKGKKGEDPEDCPESISEKRLTLHKKLDNLSPSDVRTMGVRGSRVRTIRRGAATGISEFQGGPKFCF